MNQSVIDIQGITKTYVNGKLTVPVLHGIDLQVQKGDFVSIMGPSGSGKSTFMNILGCLDRPTSGSYRLNGNEVANLSDDELAYVRNKEIGFVFQSFNLLTKLTSIENVALPMVYAGIDKKTRTARAEALLTSVGLGDRMDSKSTIDVMNIFRGLYDEGRTIILVTHEPEIATYASRNVVLRDGLIVEDKKNVNMTPVQEVTHV